MAAIGVAVTLAFPRRLERLLHTPFTLRAFGGHDRLWPCLPIWSLALYLIMGCTILGMGRGFVAHLSVPVLYLLLAGGAADTKGAVVNAWRRFRFQNVAWHVLELLGASLHWVAVAKAAIQF